MAISRRVQALPLLVLAGLAWLGRPAVAQAECGWNFPVGSEPTVSPAPLYDGHPVKGGNFLDSYGWHLGGDYWSGGGCTDLGEPVYAVADGEIVEIVDALGSYLDVVVIRHDVPELGNIYSMYGHLAREGGLSEGDLVTAGQPIGTIADVTQYFTPCHVHFEILSEAAFEQGPFCNGCAGVGYHVSPGYDLMAGVTDGQESTGDLYIEINDAIEGNRWYYTDEFIEARLGQDCSECGNAICEPDEDPITCPVDCDPGGETGTTTGDTGWDSDSDSSSGGGTGWDGGETTQGADTSGTEGQGSGDEIGDDAATSGAVEGEIVEGCACSSGRESAPVPAGWLLLFGLLGVRHWRSTSSTRS